MGKRKMGRGKNVRPWGGRGYKESNLLRLLLWYYSERETPYLCSATIHKSDSSEEEQGPTSTSSLKIFFHFPCRVSSLLLCFLDCGFNLWINSHFQVGLLQQWLIEFNFCCWAPFVVVFLFIWFVVSVW